MKNRKCVLAVGFLALHFLTGSTVDAAEPKLRWLGHAAFQYTTRTGKIFLIDPWLKNPKAPKGISFTHLEGILLTHGHSDHVGEAFELAKQFNAPVVASYELAEIAKKHGVPNAMPINASGSVTIGTVQITAVAAIHSSSYKEGDNLIYAGEPLGFIVADEGAETLYFAGDTALSYDMAFIPQLYSPQIAVLPIGGIYTMKPAEAALAARYLQVRTIVPMHFGTYPALTGTAAELQLEIQRNGLSTRVVSLEPGQEVTLKELAASRR
jgi:L-ascorbate metabolism protein UlaG (beta-lactamase superfamily)